MGKFVRTLLCTAVVAGLAMVGSAQAALLGTGSVSMAGGWMPTGGTGTIATATGVAFIPAARNVTVTAPGGQGSFSSLTAGTVGNAHDFSFNPPNTPVMGFLQIGGFNFDLLTISVDVQNSSFLELTGATKVTGVGGEGTATFEFSAQGGGSPATFSWSATAFAVPEPMSVSLLGIGLAGFGLMRRRKPLQP